MLTQSAEDVRVKSKVSFWLNVTSVFPNSPAAPKHFHILSAYEKHGQTAERIHPCYLGHAPSASHCAHPIVDLKLMNLPWCKL